MALQNYITDDLPPVADPRSADVGPRSAEAAPYTSDGAQHGTSDGISAGKVARNDTAAESPWLYLPACGALCDILWWARRSA